MFYDYTITIINLILIIIILVYFYFFIVFFIELFRIQKIDKDSIGRIITNAGIKPIKSAVYRKTSRFLLGLSKRDFFLGLVNFTLVVVTVNTLLQSMQTSEKIDRPFINLENSLLQYTKTDIDTGKFNQLSFETYLVNTGKLPAVFDVSKITVDGYTKVIKTPVEQTSGVIFPNQHIKLAWILEWNEDSEELIKWAREERDPRYLCTVCGLSITTDYRLIGEEKNKYYSLLTSEKLRTPDGKFGKFNFSFIVSGAK
ncbi:MAG: hypothetical protein AAB501_02075 [Patescibacteria group bacterium]